VTDIAEYAFESCTGLVSVKLGESVTSIGRSAFVFCIALTSMEMPGVETIGDGAFVLCSALTSVDILGVETIGSRAFRGTSLESITLGEGVISIGPSAFGGVNKGKEYGPCGNTGTTTTLFVPASMAESVYSDVQLQCELETYGTSG
jgi:hypothetical protein